VGAPTCLAGGLLSQDWSEGGLFLRTHRPARLGTLLAMSVVLGHPPLRYAFSGRIVRVREPGSPPADPRTPPGVGVELDGLPGGLLQFLGEAWQRRSLALEAAQNESSLELVDEVLLVGGEPAEKLQLALGLRLAAYDVLEVDDAAGANQLLRTRSAPVAVILLGDSARTLHAHQWVPAQTSVVIALGVPPGDLGGILAAPLVVLPRRWPLDRIPGLLRACAAKVSEPTDLLPVAGGLPA
jgi:hypothetical protein